MIQKHNVYKEMNLQEKVDDALIPSPCYRCEK